MVASITIGIVSAARAGQLGKLLSPGPLARAHGALEGGANCQRCHEAGRRVAAARCLTCHKPIADRIARRTGVHRAAKEAVDHARWTFRVIRQNLAWALAYNLVAIPLAATGHLTPLAAALGMSLSSLLVVANALRLLRGDAANSQHDTASSPIVAAGH